MLDIASLILTISIGVLSFISGFIASPGDLLLRTRTGINKISKRGKIVAIISLLSIMITAIQVKLNDYISDIKEELQYEKVKQDFDKSLTVMKTKSDSSLNTMLTKSDVSLFKMKEKYDTSVYRTTEIISTNLGKYGFKLDSSNNIIRAINSGADPFIMVDTMYILKESNGNSMLVYKIAFTTAASIVGELYIKVFAQDSSGAIKSGDYISLFNEQKYIGADLRTTGFVPIIESESNAYLYLHIKGVYYNSNRSKKYNVDELYYLNYKSNAMGIMRGESKKNLIKGT